MKYLKYFLFLLLIIPFMVLAEECDVSNITITSMKPNKIEGNTEVISDPTFEDRTINLDLKMYDVGDSISYDMTIKNDSEEDYMIDEDTFKTDSDYIEYSLKTNDNTNVVKANSTKEVSLIVTYKKEIEDDKLTNNKFNASNSLKLSLNTSEKEQPLDIITTDNIKESLDPQEVKNPVTSVSSMMLISIILLTSIVIMYILAKRKNRYTKYLLIVLSMILIPTVYAICKCDIEVESTIEIEKKQKLYDTIANLSKEENSCVTKYEGEVTDEVGKTVTASNVYFDKCVDKRNVIFDGFCWQVIRTTETSGTKLIYNGEPDSNGECGISRSDHKGIVQSNYGSSQNLTNEYLYGNSFTYDTSTKKFTLIDTTTATWSDSTYEDLIGKFTCMKVTDTCDILYNVYEYRNSTTAYVSHYTIEDTNYAGIGTSSFNSNFHSTAWIGYMYNKIYYFAGSSPPIRGSLMGNDVSYSNGTYTLLPASGESELGTSLDSTHHYSCNNTTGFCDKVRYYYYSDANNDYYIELDGEANIEEVLKNMLYNDNVNRYSSSIKGKIDAWYNQNLSDKTTMLEDVVYCNSRNIADLGAWDKNKYLRSYLLFKNHNLNNTDLSCTNITDQFAVKNNKAKLTYPVALASLEELYNLTNNNNLYYSVLTKTNNMWWSLSPTNFRDYNAIMSRVNSDGSLSGSYLSNIASVRPMISLNSEAIITSGNGSTINPWIIE